MVECVVDQRAAALCPYAFCDLHDPLETHTASEGEWRQWSVGEEGHGATNCDQLLPSYAPESAATRRDEEAVSHTVAVLIATWSSSNRSMPLDRVVDGSNWSPNSSSGNHLDSPVKVLVAVVARDMTPSKETLPCASACT